MKHDIVFAEHYQRRVETLVQHKVRQALNAYSVHMAHTLLAVHAKGTPEHEIVANTLRSVGFQLEDRE